jgi:hypothetical protein
MLDKIQTNATNPPVEMQLPFDLVEAQERGVVFFTELNDLMVKTARAVSETQIELLRLDVEQGAKAFAPVKIGEDPGAMSAYCDRLHEQTDRMIAQMRQVNDLYMDYGWGLLAIYAQGLRHAAGQSQTSRTRR